MLSQGAKVFLGAGLLGAAALTVSRRARAHEAHERGNVDTYANQEYEPRYSRLPKVSAQAQRKDTGAGPVHVVPSDGMQVSDSAVPMGDVPPVGTTAALWEKQKQRGGLSAVPRGNVNGTDMSLEKGRGDVPSGRLPPSDFVEQRGLRSDHTGGRSGAGPTGAAGQRSGMSSSASSDGGKGVLDRLGEMADVVGEHAKAAAADVSQTASEVGRVLSEHGKQASADVSTAASETKAALLDDKPLGAVRVRDTPDLVRPEAGRGVGAAERSVPLGSGNGGDRRVGGMDSDRRSSGTFADDRYRGSMQGGSSSDRSLGGSDNRTSLVERAAGTAGSAAGAVKGAGNAAADALRDAGSRVKENVQEAGDRLRDAGRDMRDNISGDAGRYDYDAGRYDSGRYNRGMGMGADRAPAAARSQTSSTTTTTARRESGRAIPLPGTGAPSIMGGFDDDHHTVVTAGVDTDDTTSYPGRGDTGRHEAPLPGAMGMGSDAVRGQAQRGWMNQPTGGTGVSPMTSSSYRSDSNANERPRTSISGGYESRGRSDVAGSGGMSGSSNASSVRVGDGRPSKGMPVLPSPGGSTANANTYANRETYSAGSGMSGVSGARADQQTTTSSSSSGSDNFASPSGAGTLGGPVTGNTVNGSTKVTRVYGDQARTSTIERDSGAGTGLGISTTGGIHRAGERVEEAGSRLWERSENALERARGGVEGAAQRVRADAAAARDSVRAAEDAAAARMRQDAAAFKDSFRASERNAEAKLKREAEEARGKAAATAGAVSGAAQHVRDDLWHAAGHAKRDAQAVGGAITGSDSGPSRSG